MIMKKTSQILALGAAATLTSINAYAADKELLGMLLQNGSINQTQYNTLIEKETISKKDVNDIKVSLGKKGLQFATADKQFKLKIGARLHADASFHSGDNDLDSARATNGTEIRRARIYLKGIMWEDFKYISEFDFADNSVAVKDLFVTYKGLDWLEITAGHQKQSISMELQESSNDIMFTERSLVNTITGHAFDRAIGFHLKSKGKDWSAQIGAYGESVGPSKVKGDEGWGMTSRVTYSPINTKDQVVHLGAYGGFRETNDNGDILNGTKGTDIKYETTHLSNLYLTSANNIANAENLSIAGFEAAYMQGPFSVQGEYAQSWLSRDGAPTLDLNAFYVQTGWTLTGESRSYKGSDGEFKRLKPAQKFSLKDGGGWGALELAARYDQADINSENVDGGSEKAVTVALNWYLNENLRVMADYRRAFDVNNKGEFANETDPGDLEEIDTFSLRGQWAF